MQITAIAVMSLSLHTNLRLFRHVNPFCLRQWRDLSPPLFHVMDGHLQVTRATRASTRVRWLAAGSRASAARVAPARRLTPSRRTLHRRCPRTAGQRAVPTYAGLRSHSLAPTTAGRAVTSAPGTSWGRHFRSTWLAPVTSCPMILSSACRTLEDSLLSLLIPVHIHRCSFD